VYNNPAWPCQAGESNEWEATSDPEYADYGGVKRSCGYDESYDSTPAGCASWCRNTAPGAPYLYSAMSWGCQCDNSYHTANEGTPTTTAAGSDIYPLMEDSECQNPLKDHTSVRNRMGGRFDCGQDLDLDNDGDRDRMCRSRIAVYNLADYTSGLPTEVGCYTDRSAFWGNQAKLDLSGGEDYARNGAWQLALVSSRVPQKCDGALPARPPPLTSERLPWCTCAHSGSHGNGNWRASGGRGAPGNWRSS
jgi:hypothetical protein